MNRASGRLVRLCRGGLLLIVALVAVPGCRLLARRTPPPPARGVVLVLAEGFEESEGAARPPALRGLVSRARRFENAFAPDPQAKLARGLLLQPAGRSLSALFAERGSAVATVGDAGPRADTVAGALEIREPLSVAARPGGRLEQWLRAQSGRFLLVVTIGSGAPLPLAPAATRDSAPPLPRIAAADMGAAERPGGMVQPQAWSAVSKQRASALALERALVADGALGSLLALLGRTAQDSAIVLVGDPPADRGLHGQVRRPGLFDDTLRSTLLVAAPGLAGAGRSCARLVSTRDVAPTLLALAGLPAVPQLEGRSLMPLLADADAAWPEEVVSSTARLAPRIARSARSARWRYTEWPDGSAELYDHERDPAEITNLAGRPELRGPLAELRAALARDAALGAVPVAPDSPPAVSGGRPLRASRNVVLVIVDDLNTRLGAWGAPVRTPSIDRLAARGVRFDRAYVPVAMCSPSRSSVLLGWRPVRTNVWNNQDPPRPAGAVPIEEYFQAHGAETAAIGKIYHFPEQFRFDLREEHPQLVEDEREGFEVAPGEALFVAAPGDDRDQPDGQRALRAVALLERYRARRFFLALGLVRPHRRWIAPARYFGLYPPELVAAPAYPADDLADVPAIAIKTRPQPLPGLPLLGREPPGLVPDPELRRQAIAAYSACTTFADAQVGRVLDALDRLSLWDDTIVVLMGDNGYHLGEHRGLLRKDTLFEEGVRVPLIIAAPGVAPAVVRAPVGLLDLYPTIVELAGLPPVPGIDGQSLSPQLAHPEAASRGPALSYRRVRPPERAFSIRTTRLRYTLWPDGSEELRSASGADVSERPEWADEKAQLRKRLGALVAGTPAARR